jgi:hypothetical protein
VRGLGDLDLAALVQNRLRSCTKPFCALVSTICAIGVLPPAA